MARAPKHRPVAETGILLERDVKLKIEWPKFAGNLTKTVVAGFAAAHGGIQHGGEALASLLEAGGSISVDASAGQRGWTLFALAFAWSFDELRARGSLDETGLEAAVGDALEEARRLVDQGDQTVPASHSS